MQPQANRQQVRRVLVITLVLNLSVALGKIILGAMTGALAIFADGIHSLTDGTGNVVGLVALHYAGRPPDDDHPYGHRRFETMAALLIGALLLLTAWEMIQGVIERLGEGSELEITPLTFAVLIGTLIVNIFVSRYQIRQGTRLNSEILLADARNTSADVFVTLSVILSMVLVSLTGWIWVDLVAAAVVVALIVRAAWQILHQTGRVLVDTAPYSPEELSALLEDLPGETQLVRARSRGPADDAQIDIDLAVNPAMTADHSSSIAQAVRDRLEEALGSVGEVEVHFVPHTESAADLALTIRACADTMGLAAHDIQVRHSPNEIVLEMHVEVGPDLNLADAHEQVSRLESAIHARMPEIDRIVTHIEPLMHQYDINSDEHLNHEAREVEGRALDLLHTGFPDVDWHEVSTVAAPEGFAMTLHAALPSILSVGEAHQIAEDAETLLRAQVPRLVRVIIHTEPVEA